MGWLDTVADFDFEQLAGTGTTTHAVNVDANVNRLLIAEIEGADGFGNKVNVQTFGNGNIVKTTVGTVLNPAQGTGVNTTNANDGTQPDHTTQDNKVGNVGAGHTSCMGDLATLPGVRQVGKVRFSIRSDNDGTGATANPMANGDGWRLFGSILGAAGGWVTLASGTNTGNGTIDDKVVTLNTNLYNYYLLEVYGGSTDGGSISAYIYDFRIYDSADREYSYGCSSVSYNGVNLTRIGGSFRNLGGIEVWALLAPASGNNNLTVNTFVATGPGPTIKITAYSIFNAVQDLSQIVFVGNDGGASPATYTVTPGTNHTVVLGSACFGLTTADAAASATQTAGFTLDANRNTFAIGGGHTKMLAEAESLEKFSTAVVNGSIASNNAASNWASVAVAVPLLAVAGLPPSPWSEGVAALDPVPMMLHDIC